jgi:ATP-binding cassette subfamily C (CFTR/MRP) protein 1
MTRGFLVMTIYDKTLKLDASSEELPGAMTLMSTDVEQITAGLQELHDVWASLLGTIVGCTILGTMGKTWVEAVYFVNALFR